MKIKYISDIHLEFAPLDNIPKGDADVLILAGDIDIKGRVEWINAQLENFEHVIYVTGNHEYYRSNITHLEERIEEDLDPRIHFLQNSSVKIENTVFHGTTLWTDMKPEDEWFANKGMADFSVIRIDEDFRRFTAYDSKLAHYAAMDYLKNSVNEGDVIITHHAPSFKSSLDCFIGSTLNPAFATDLSEFMFIYKPSFWVHGHMHNTSDYTIGGTNVLCNPRGYPVGDGENENREFDVNKTFEIGEKYANNL